MRAKTSIAAALALGLGMCAAWVSEAGATASTHIWGPSADVQAFGVWHFTSDLYIAEGNDAAGARPSTITNIGLTVGVLPAKRINAEIGFDHKTGLGSLDDEPMYGNAKIGVPENALVQGSPAVACGIFDVGTREGSTDYNVFYGKVARTFSVGGVSLGRFSAGYFKGNEDLLVDGEGEPDDQGLLAAWERTLAELSDRLWICVEYMGTESAYGCFNAGASWKFADNVSVLGGYEVFNNDDLVNTFTLQVDIDI